MTYLDVIVVGHPRAQPRPRVFRSGRVQTDSDATLEWKAAIVAAILATGYTRAPDDAPLHLDLEIALPTAQKLRLGRWATSRPDFDNLAKAAVDALMAPESRAFAAAVQRLPGGPGYAGVVADDGQIASVRLTKRWSAAPGGARIRLSEAGTSLVC